MSDIIGAYGGYRKTMEFGFACLVYHATCAFCRRNYDYRNDSLGKTTGQMVGAPKCPKCGKAMRKMVARKGRNAGNPFWSCTGYPDCNGTRNYVEGGGET